MVKETTKIYIHCGGYACDNGQVNPIMTMIDLAKCIDDCYIIYGCRYGEDCIEFNEEDLSLVTSLLDETKLPYKFNLCDEWRNVCYNSSFHVQLINNRFKV